jgi:SAM-dependent methyltransferase
MKSEFDAYAKGYESALERGLAVSGEDSAYFARERIVWLSRCLGDRERKALRVLDFGCGTGNATPFFFQVLGAATMIGVDPSELSIEEARSRWGSWPVEFRRTNEYEPDGTMDLVFCNGVFHHIPPDDRASAMHYISRCLRPSGVLALWENNPWSPAARYVMSRIPFDRDAVMVWPKDARDLASQAGLTVESTDFCFIFPRLLSWCRSIEPWLRKLALGAQYQVLCSKK